MSGKTIGAVATVATVIVAFIGLLYTAGVLESGESKTEREERVRKECAESDMVESTPWHSRKEALENCVNTKIK